MEYKFLSFRKGINKRSSEIIYLLNSVLDLTGKRDIQIKKRITLQHAVQMHMQLGISYSLLLS